MTTNKSKRTYNAPKGTKITGVEMLNDGKVLLTFAEDEGDVKEFKKGDIVTTSQTKVVAIINTCNKDRYSVICSAIDGVYSKGYDGDYILLDECNLATPSEQQVLFDALAKEGKRWNKETLEIEDIKEEFKRGDILTAVGVGWNGTDITFVHKTYNELDNAFYILCGGVSSVEHNGKYLLRDTRFKYGFNKDKVRHATPSEIEQFDNDLKSIGKKWNRDTLEIEVIAPDFKEGDIIHMMRKDCNTPLISVVKYSRFAPKEYAVSTIYRTDTEELYYMNTNVLAENVLSLASESQIELINDILLKNNSKYNFKTLEVEDLDISEIAVDLPTACEYLKEPMPQNYAYDAETPFERKINAQIEFQMICKAWNKFDGFVVDWNDRKQSKYFPIVNDDKIIHSYDSIFKTIELACYSFKSHERATQFGNQFKELFKTAMGIE